MDQSVYNITTPFGWLDYCHWTYVNTVPNLRAFQLRFENKEGFNYPSWVHYTREYKWVLLNRIMEYGRFVSQRPLNS